MLCSAEELMASLTLKVKVSHVLFSLPVWCMLPRGSLQPHESAYITCSLDFEWKTCDELGLGNSKRVQLAPIGQLVHAVVVTNPQ
jgi:hypothetical protein